MLEDNNNENEYRQPDQTETGYTPYQEQTPYQEPAQYQQPTYQYQPTYNQVASEPDVPKKKSHLGLKIASLAVVCALVGTIGGGAVVAKIITDRLDDGKSGSSLEGETTSKPEAAVAVTPAATADGYSDPIVVSTNSSGAAMTPADIYERYADAVVGINCESTTNVYGQISTTASSGSGFIITADGYVVTNCHVIADAQSVTVLMKDETTYPAEVVGYDEDNDVALLKIEATDLPTVSVGNSDGIKVGQQVVAIGNPLGELTHTLTAGYISSLDREINTDGNPINMLQTDAAINAGNSGGPLFDAQGNVIGITTAKYASSTIEGLGFAIPINDAMSIVYSIQQFGYVKGKPSFGITVGTLNLSYASYYGMPVGCVVNSVNSGSCAENAGLQAGDIITKIGDENVKSVTELSAEMKNYSSGETAEITLYRQSEYLTVSVTFDEELPDYMQEDKTEDTEPQQDQEQQQQSPFGSFDPFSFFFGNGGSSSGSSSNGGTAA